MLPDKISDYKYLSISTFEASFPPRNVSSRCNVLHKATTTSRKQKKQACQWYFCDKFISTLTHN